MQHIVSFSKTCGFLMVFFIVIIGCQKDDEIQQDGATPSSVHQEELHHFSRKVTLKDVPEVKSYLIATKMGYIKTYQTRGNEYSNSFGTVDTTNIQALDYSYGTTAITMRLVPYTPEKGTLHNLIVIVDKYQQILDSYVRTYINNNYSDGKIVTSDFDGRMISSELDGSKRGSTDMSRGIFLGRPPCYECEIDDLPDDTDDSPNDTDDPDDTNDGPDDDGINSGGSDTSDVPTDTGDGGVPNIICTFGTLVRDCGGTNKKVWHPGPECGGPNGPNGSGAQTYSTLLTVSCTVADKAPGNPMDIPIACCEDDIIIIEEDDTEEPCDILNDLENDQDFKDQMELLQNLAQTDNKETAFKMVADGEGGYDFSPPIEGLANELGLDPQVANNEQIDEFIHNHWNKPKSLSVFSPHDLYFLYKSLKEGNINDVNSFIFAITTSDNTTYAITIEDSGSLIAFGDANLEGLQFTNSRNNSLPSQYNGSRNTLLENDGGIKDSNSNNINETNFLKLLSFANAGLKVFKSDDNFENWQQIEYNMNTNSVTVQNCN